MFNSLRAIVRYFCLWLLFFCVERLVFLLFFYKKIKEIQFSETFKSIIYGLWMDISTAGYFTILPLIVFVVLWFIPGVRIKSAINRIYFRTLIVICSIITVINFNIYREWGTKVNSRAFDFLLSSPGDAFASSVSSPLFISFLILALLIAFGFFLSKFAVVIIARDAKWYLKLPVALLLLGLNFLAIRGGWQLAPMNESKAYYSSTPILNHAAVNTEWSLLHSVLSGSKNKNPYKFYKPNEAESIVKELYPSPASGTTSILSSPKPNLVFVIMESFTADVVESLGGEKGIDPGIESLIPQGILFKNIYASGDRTDKGVVSILSAFPTQGFKSIMKESEKHSRMNSLFKVLKPSGYHSSFYYGGETEFANMKSYLLNTGCEELVDKSDFDKKDMNSKWGAYDDVVYKKVLRDVFTKKEPFITTVLTLTNHEPFELPVQSHFKGDEDENKFRSTAYYSDSCLTAFINNAKKQPWYKNTLFVIVADHGHRLPKNQYEIHDVHRFRIPLLFFGEVIKPEFRGEIVEKVGSQTDIAATLLGQLNISSASFRWSKDLLNKNGNGHAFYSWDNGFGYVNANNEALTFDKVSQSIVYKTDGLDASEEKASLRFAKGYMQSVFREYSEY